MLRKSSAIEGFEPRPWRPAVQWSTTRTTLVIKYLKESNLLQECFDVFVEPRFVPPGHVIDLGRLFGRCDVSEVTNHDHGLVLETKNQLTSKNF